MSSASGCGRDPLPPRDRSGSREIDVGIPTVTSAAAERTKLQERRSPNLKGRQLRQTLVVEWLPVQRNRDEPAIDGKSGSIARELRPCEPHAEQKDRSQQADRGKDADIRHLTSPSTRGARGTYVVGRARQAGRSKSQTFSSSPLSPDRPRPPAAARRTPRRKPSRGRSRA